MIIFPYYRPVQYVPVPYVLYCNLLYNTSLKGTRSEAREMYTPVSRVENTKSQLYQANNGNNAMVLAFTIYY